MTFNHSFGGTTFPVVRRGSSGSAVVLMHEICGMTQRCIEQMLLYKYMPGPIFFSSFKFRFTPAEDLNDPQELVPDIRLRDPGAYARDITERNIKRAYFNLLILNPNLTPAEAWARCVAAAQKIEQQFDAHAKVREV